MNAQFRYVSETNAVADDYKLAREWSPESAMTTQISVSEGAYGNATPTPSATAFQKRFGRALEQIVSVAASDGFHITSNTRELAKLMALLLEAHDPSVAVPNVALAPEDQLLLEWWYGPRKLSIYVGDQGAEFVQVWGPNIDTEMADGAIENGGQLLSLYQWLRGI